MYDAFHSTILSRLQSHHSDLQHVKKITRGSQFESYSQGAMLPKGAHAPMGGAPGDSYTFYSGMEAVTEEGIRALFNDAEVNFLIVFYIEI